MPSGGTFGAPSAVEILQLSDLSDVTAKTGTGTTVVMQGSPTITSPTIATIVNTGTLTLPTSTDTLVGRATTDTLTNKTLTSPTINAGTATALTGLAVRSTGTGAFDLTFANTENLTAGRTITVTVRDAARTIDLSGDITIAAAFVTSGANSLTLTTTGATNVTLPTTGTLATLGGAETFTNKTLTTPTIGTVNGSTAASGTLTLTATTNATTGAIIFNRTTGTENARFLSTGELLVGATALLAVEYCLFRKDGNGSAPQIRAHNGTSGTVATGTITVTNNTNVGLSLQALSSGYTTNGALTANDAVIAEFGAPASILIDATGALPIRFAISNSEVAQYTSTGRYQFTPPALSSATTSIFNITSAVNTGGAISYFAINGAASTGQTASTEIPFANFNFSQTVTWATGALTTERAFLIQSPTLAFAGASTVTNSITVAITAAPTAGANATITNSFALQVGGAVNIGATASGTIYAAIDIPAHTLTVTGTTQVTSVGPAGIRIGTLTITDSSAVTINNAAALYIAAAPVAAGSVTLTNVYSIWVDAGVSRFDGNLDFSTSDSTNFVLGTTTGTKIGTATTQKIGFFNATPVVQQTDGATLTNNVTAGGTNDTIANYTDLTTYSNDAAAIRNDIYQLSRKLKITVDALRSYGLLS